MDWLVHLTDAPFANILVLAGLGFLAVGLFGKIIGKIEPDKTGRIASAAAGIILLFIGLFVHSNVDQGNAATTSQTSVPTNVTPGAPKSPKPPAGSDTCKPGFVWREATSEDHVCVSPATRQETQQQNREAAAHRSTSGGPYGPDTCLPGYVWREATRQDHVCVTSAVRAQAAADNADSPSRRSSQ